MPNKEQYKKLKDAGVIYTQVYKIKKRESTKKYSINNIEKIKVKNKLYYQKIKDTNSYKERVKKNWKKWKDNNRDKLKSYYRSYYIKHLNDSDWSENRKKYLKKYLKTYRELKKYYYANKSKEWRKNNSLKKNISQRKYRKNLRRTNLKWTLVERLRSRIWKALKGNSKTTTTENLLGCTLEEFKIYLEFKFKKDMTWDNYGLWHIDHIKPCASFDLVCPVQQLSCFHYKNLQPLWASENMSKGSKLIDIQ
jgi:hypothetical protein